MAPAPLSAINLGHIDDVQELRNCKSSHIPPRFIRDTTERPALDKPTFCSDTIPLIDLSKLAKGTTAELHKLMKACQEWGFFQIVNHGIDGSYGQAFIFSEDQKLDWCNMFALGVIPNYIRNPKLWPSNPSDFSETVETYSAQVRQLCKNLLKHIATTLALKEDVFEEMFGVAVQAVRMNSYPACPRPDLVLGLSPHSDGSALTVLQQGKGSSVGLQILKDGKWISVQPIPNALVINIGDTIEVLTNGRYKSVEHKAVTHKEKDRLSIVTFYAPSYDIELGPMQEFVDENNPCKYRTYNHGEYSKHYVTNKLQGKKRLEFAKIVN
ncbi:hypothetical protein SASPL_112370 [Salvia splendens]|uniref:Fe2OG dioxygenase domain-containing protein n=1 Tax=Salvia splendens TaxID=180675 RepID=A0A8X8Y8N3_SALSN|nr:hypothetical protein SASPL_112370 [Salvia splendens]